jgi:hypothetical protein
MNRVERRRTGPRAAAVLTLAFGVVELDRS